MGKIIPILIMAFIFLAIALAGCTNPATRTAVTVGPTVIPETVTPAPTPAIASPTVTTTGGVTTVRGSNNQYIKDIRLGDGVYVISWSGPRGISLVDPGGEGWADVTKGRTSGEKLLIVDYYMVHPGDFLLTVASDSKWEINIARPDASSPSTLPLSLSCSEQDGAVSKPFRAKAGSMWISYSLSHMPYGTGHVEVYDVYSGKSVYTRPITDGYTSGQSMAEAPADGVYIAQVTLPEGASYGDITISQQGQ